MSTTQEIAAKMLALYGGDPRRWTQGSYCRYDEDYNACSWCVWGAAGEVASGYAELTPFMVEARERLGVPDLAKWNDAPERTFHDVVKLLTDIAEAP